MDDSGHTTHELGWALRAGTQQKKRMFTKYQHRAERHELHKGDPGPQSRGDQAMGQRRERQVSQMTPRCQVQRERRRPLGQGTAELALRWAAHVGSSGDGQGPGGTLGTRCMSFLRVSSFESVKAGPQVTPQHFMAYLQSPCEFYT